jgi:hypothetical protein
MARCRWKHPQIFGGGGVRWSAQEGGHEALRAPAPRRHVRKAASVDGRSGRPAFIAIDPSSQRRAVVFGKGCSVMTDEDDSRWDGTGLIAQAIWDYWNVGSTKRLISVLRSESPLTSADRQLLADFIEAELKGSRKDSKPTLEYLMQPDKSLAKRSAAAEVERIIKELRDKTGKTHGHEKVVPISCPPEKMRKEFDEELRILLRRLKKNQKDPS